MAVFMYKGEQYPLIDPDVWTTLEAIKLEAHSGRKPAELIQDFASMGALGVHAMAWVSLKRAGIDVAWDQLELPFLDTLMSVQGDPVTEPPDPLTASTEEPKDERRTPSENAPLLKK